MSKPTKPKERQPTGALRQLQRSRVPCFAPQSDPVELYTRKQTPLVKSTEELYAECVKCSFPRFGQVPKAPFRERALASRTQYAGNPHLAPFHGNGQVRPHALLTLSCSEENTLPALVPHEKLDLAPTPYPKRQLRSRVVLCGCACYNRCTEGARTRCPTSGHAAEREHGGWGGG